MAFQVYQGTIMSRGAANAEALRVQGAQAMANAYASIGRDLGKGIGDAIESYRQKKRENASTKVLEAAVGVAEFKDGLALIRERAKTAAEYQLPELNKLTFTPEQEQAIEAAGVPVYRTKTRVLQEARDLRDRMLSAAKGGDPVTRHGRLLEYSKQLDALYGAYQGVFSKAQSDAAVLGDAKRFAGLKSDLASSTHDAVYGTLAEAEVSPESYLKLTSVGGWNAIGVTGSKAEVFTFLSNGDRVGLHEYVTSRGLSAHALDDLEGEYSTLHTTAAGFRAKVQGLGMAESMMQAMGSLHNKVGDASREAIRAISGSPDSSNLELEDL